MTQKDLFSGGGARRNPRKYYTLAIFENGRWSPHFGDYDKENVQIEATAFPWRDYPRKHVKIIVTGPAQKDIDAKIAQMNAIKANPVRAKGLSPVDRGYRVYRLTPREAALYDAGGEARGLVHERIAEIIKRTKSAGVRVIHPKGYIISNTPPTKKRLTREIARAKRNPVRAGAHRSPPKRNPRPPERYYIRGEQKIKGGYLYYYLSGDRFLSGVAKADTFGKAEGEMKMRAILPKLPAEIRSITLVKKLK